MVILSGQVEIPLPVLLKTNRSREVLARVEKDLCFSVEDSYSGKPRIQIIRAYSLTAETLKVPRRYYRERIAPFTDLGKEVNREASGELAHWKFTSQLKDSAKRNQVAAVDALTNTSGGILAAMVGSGKTVMGLAAIAKIGRRALIVVPTEHLMQQWADEAVKHTSLRPSDIGRVQGDQCDWKKPLIVATVQSLSQRRYPQQLYDSVGILVADEIHRYGGEHWGQVIPQFPAKIRWGLSATVERRDGMHRAFMWHIGPIIYEMLELDVVPKVVVLRSGIGLPESAYTNCWNGEVNFSKMQSALADVPERNMMLAEQIVGAYKAGRKILALSKRLKQLALMQKLLGKKIPAKEIGVINGQTERKKADKGKRQKILDNCRVILAVDQIAGLGLNQPDLDTLFWMIPSPSVEQNVGRILRAYPISDGHEYVKGKKKRPLVVDIQDDFAIAVAMSRNRLKKFSKAGYEYTIFRHRS